MMDTIGLPLDMHPKVVVESVGIRAIGVPKVSKRQLPLQLSLPPTAVFFKS
uniref:Uncharacterized protein n=1 Tax=Lepeophtheirus salmonis TaxID=72036 RepID=A0A0K2T5W4_LEPSM